MSVPEASPPTGPAAPERLRALLRGSEVGLVVLAALLGVAAGIVVTAMGWALQALHVLVFQIAPDARLSAQASLPPLLALAGPVLGGLAFGIVSWLVFRRRPQPVDPIEANALHGGRMSLPDSLIVGAQTVASSGVGASVGLEAGYTQAAGGIASYVGGLFHLRRADRRLMVGAAAGAAIGAAFDAPLAGAFYAFELILGSYSIAAFAPVMAATFAANVTRRALEGAPDVSAAPVMPVVEAGHLPAILLLGLIAALVGIAVMRTATLVETGFRRSHIPAWLRPAMGGAVVGLLALVSPAVLSAGHGAVHHFLLTDQTLAMAAALFVAKAAASSVSIGSGFRGGLFFASLLMGVLLGKLYAAGLGEVLPGLPDQQALFAIVGMGTLAVSVVGGPMTMTLLALEMTGDLGLTVAVLGAAGVSSLVTRRLFGFSFATWRFHLRGENIRGAHDIGWMRELTVESLMRRDVATIGADARVAQARAVFPPGSTASLVAIEADGAYAGLVPLPLLYAAEPDAPLRPLLAEAQRMLTAEMTITQALDAFGETEDEVLAVVESAQSRRLVGVLSEARAVRRYSDEVSLRNRELSGE